MVDDRAVLIKLLVPVVASALALVVGCTFSICGLVFICVKATSAARLFHAWERGRMTRE